MSDENIEYLMAKLSQIDSGFSTPPTDAKRSLSAFQHSAFANSIAAKPCAEIVHRCFHLFSALRVGICKIDRVAVGQLDKPAFSRGVPSASFSSKGPR